MLSGERPFAGKDIAETMRNVVAARVKNLVARASWVPSDVWRVLRQALSQKPEERFGNMHDFEQALREASSTVPVGFRECVLTEPSLCFQSAVPPDHVQSLDWLSTPHVKVLLRASKAALTSELVLASDINPTAAERVIWELFRRGLLIAQRTSWARQAMDSRTEITNPSKVG
jgi:hypothetical protein